MSSLRDSIVSHFPPAALGCHIPLAGLISQSSIPLARSKLSSHAHTKSAAPPQIRAFPQAVEAVPFKNHFNFENQFEKLIRSALACSANLLDSGFLGSFLLAR